MCDSESMKRVRLGITMGDPAGIGPEIILKVLRNRQVPDIDVVVYGARQVLELEEKNLGGWGDGVESLVDTLNVVDVMPSIRFEEHPAGQGDARGAQIQGRALQEAMEDAKAGRIDGIVTAPWNKELFETIGAPVVGHTEVLAEAFESPDVVMMLGGERLRVALVTVHLPLAEVAGRLSVERIVATTRTTVRGLARSFGIERPHVAVAALNPHAGEGGHMGSEEARIIMPAMERLRRAFPEVVFSGPLPADTLFAKYRGGKTPYDVVICMYHDQGLIPLKLVHFGASANVTLGLPVVRTSVDHGTAYDIAGRGIADEGSLAYAMELAVTMVRQRRTGREGRGRS